MTSWISKNSTSGLQVAAVEAKGREQEGIPSESRESAVVDTRFEPGV